MTVTLKYNGIAGNSVTWIVGAADDGDPNHFNLTVTVTGASGTTTDVVHNINISGTGADAIPSVSSCLLIGSLTKLASGVPVVGGGTFAGGADGTITSTNYVGTQGAADQGIAKLESDKTIDHVFTGDPGNSLRAAVNAGLKAHADYMTDRIAWLNGNSGQTSAAAITDVANYRSLRAVYVDPWVYIYDDTTGAKTLVPPAPFAASVAAQLPPSTSIAWKASEVQALLSGVIDLEADRGDAAANQTDAGIVTMIREDLGGFTFESAKNTMYPSDPARGSIKRTRMGHFLARSITTSLRPYTDSPNVPANQQDEIDAVDAFLSGLKRNLSRDPNHNTHIVDYGIADVTAANPSASIAAGQFTLPVQVKISADQEKIFIGLQFGETVTVTATL
jgi:phage tail sheath protein FI